MQAGMAGREELAYSSYEQLVLEHGSFMTADPLTKHMDRGELGDCYKNATLDILGRAKGLYSYCEGFARSSRIPIPLPHAWIATQGIRGGHWAVDPTWEYDPDTIYIGVAFELRFLVETISRTGYYGLFCNDYLDKHRFIREGIPDGALRTLP